MKSTRITFTTLSISMLAFMALVKPISAMAQQVLAEPNSTSSAKARPVMTYELATLMQEMFKAEERYRQTADPVAKAQADALRMQLADQGFGRVNRPIHPPVLSAPIPNTPMNRHVSNTPLPPNPLAR